MRLSDDPADQATARALEEVMGMPMAEKAKATLARITEKAYLAAVKDDYVPDPEAPREKQLEQVDGFRKYMRKHLAGYSRKQVDSIVNGYLSNLGYGGSRAKTKATSVHQAKRVESTEEE